MAAHTSGYTDVLRFALTRNPVKHEPVARLKRFIVFDLDLRAIKVLPDAKSLLIVRLATDLTKFRDRASWVQATLEAVADTFAGKRAIAAVDKLPKAYLVPELETARAWLLAHPRSDAGDLAKKLDKLGVDPQAFTARASFFDERVTLWENLLALYLVPRAPEVRQSVIDGLRWDWILQRLAVGDPHLQSASDVRSAAHATPLVPAFAQAPAPIEAVPDAKLIEREAAAERARNQADAKARASVLVYRKSLVVALTEVDATYSRQMARPADRDAFVVTSGNPPTAMRNSTDGVTVQPPASMGSRSGTAKSPSAGGGSGLVPPPPVKHWPDAALEFLAGPVALSAQSTKVLKALGVSPATTPVRFLRAALLDAMRSSYTSDVVNARARMSLRTGNSVVHLDDHCIHYERVDPCGGRLNRARVPEFCGRVSSEGFADLRVVRTKLDRYEFGEIAHVENVLIGESKTHTFRSLKRDERTQVDESEDTTQTDDEIQSTDRFELAQEMSKIVKDDMKFDAGVTVSADMGSVKLGTNVNFATSHASEEASKQSQKIASELINRAVKRVTERRRKQVTTVSVVESAETDEHKLTNVGGTEHVRGVYRWLDKYYEATVENYGMRYLLEFAVPEPAAFHVFRKIAQPEPGETRLRPEPPRNPDDDAPLSSHLQLTAGNYGQIAAQYHAPVSPPPEPLVVVGVSVKNESTSTVKSGEEERPFPMASEESKSLSVPPGYVAVFAKVNADGRYVTTKVLPNNVWNPFDVQQVTVATEPPIGSVFVGQAKFDFNTPAYWKQMAGESGLVPVSVLVSTSHFIANIEVACIPTDRRREEWQIATMAAIQQAYQAAITDYQTWLERKNVRSGVVIKGENPGMNRQTEREELKRSVIEILTRQRFDAFGAINYGALGYPEIDFDRAHDEGRYVQFFEQAFEWENMTYLFYPYFWGRKARWVVNLGNEDLDPIFTKFLQAGYARVVVPVRPAFYKAVMHFLRCPMNKAEIWLGEDLPGPDDPMYVSIADEIKADAGQFTKPNVEETFPIKLPTNLVMLQSASTDFPVKET